jgi:hypothetical protein
MGRPRLGGALLLAILLSPSAVSLGALGERFTDPESGYTIRPPQGWEERAQPLEAVSVVFGGPSFEGFSANLNIVILPGRIEVTPPFLADLARRLRAEFESAEAGVRTGGVAAPAGNRTPRRYRITRRGITRIAGAKGAYLEARYEEGRRDGGVDVFRQFQVVVPGPVEHYVLTYTARAEAFEASLAEVQASVNSFTPALGPPRAAGGPAGWLGRFGLALLAAIAGVLIVLARRAAGGRRRRGRPAS